MKTQASVLPPIRIFLCAVLLGLCACFGSSIAQTGASDPAFPRPPGIRAAVAFWTKVYSDIDSNRGYIHDNRRLDIVYETFPLPRHASPKRQHRLIRKRIRHYRDLLRSIARTPAAKLTAEQQRVRRLWGADVTPSRLRAAADRVRFQRGQADRMKAGLQRATLYQKGIRRILRDAGVPEQLAALPHVESSYNPRVRSKAGASGLWQIMPATGRRYLRIDNVVDERLDPYKATRAAAQLLKHNHSVLGSWPLAITAYNHGLSGVRRAVRKTGSTDIAKIVDSYRGRRFKFASRNFYAAFLAALDVADRSPQAQKQHAGTGVPSVVLTRYLPAAAVIETFGIDRQLLHEHNPDLGASVWNGDKHIPAAYRLHLPTALGKSELQTRFARLQNESGQAAQIPDRIYRVKPGDNLERIARANRTSIETLVAMNSLRSRHRINAGQLLKIPENRQAVTATVDPGPAAVAAAGPPGPEPPDADPGMGTTPDPEGDPKDDTASPEAPVDDADLGELTVNPSELGADPADYQVSQDGTIEVQIGETLGHYSHWLGVTTRALRTINGMRHGQHVVVGNRLRLPASSTGPRAFERRRKRFHSDIQDRFFAAHRITGIKEHTLTDGDNLWDLSMQTYRVPLWLLRQYNPDLRFDTLLPLSASIRVPIVESAANGSGAVGPAVDE